MNKINENDVQEIKALVKSMKYREMDFCKLHDEVDRLNNVINELEKWCDDCITCHIAAREDGQTTISDTFFEMVLNKIKELKENKQ